MEQEEINEWKKVYPGYKCMKIKISNVKMKRKL